MGPRRRPHAPGHAAPCRPGAQRRRGQRLAARRWRPGVVRGQPDCRGRRQRRRRKQQRRTRDRGSGSVRARPAARIVHASAPRRAGGRRGGSGGGGGGAGGGARRVAPVCRRRGGQLGARQPAVQPGELPGARARHQPDAAGARLVWLPVGAAGALCAARRAAGRLARPLVRGGGGARGAHAAGRLGAAPRRADGRADGARAQRAAARRGRAAAHVWVVAAVAAGRMWA